MRVVRTNSMYATAPVPALAGAAGSLGARRAGHAMCGMRQTNRARSANLVACSLYSRAVPAAAWQCPCQPCSLLQPVADLRSSVPDPMGRAAMPGRLSWPCPPMPCDFSTPAPSWRGWCLDRSLHLQRRSVRSTRSRGSSWGRLPGNGDGSRRAKASAHTRTMTPKWPNNKRSRVAAARSQAQFLVPAARRSASGRFHALEGGQP